MKTLKTSIFAATFALAALVSCTSQDDIYKEFVKDGGLIYPAKAADVKSETGFNKVTLFWPVPKDPSVRSARIYWDNKTDSIDLNYSDFTDTVSVKIVNLDDRSYTFTIVNFDKFGNKSMESDLTATPYGKNWLSTHEERQFKHAWVDGTTATVQLTESTSEMVATKFRYKNLDGEWVEFGPRMTPREVNFKLTNAMRGKYFEFSSGFLPSDGRDTAWMEWTKSSYPIVYPLDTKDWTVTATTGGTMGENTPDKIFDGIADANHRWHSTAGNNFPRYCQLTPIAKPEKSLLTRLSPWLVTLKRATVTSSTSRFSQATNRSIRMRRISLQYSELRYVIPCCTGVTTPAAGTARWNQDVTLRLSSPTPGTSRVTSTFGSLLSGATSRLMPTNN